MLATKSSTTSFFDRSILPWLICSIGMLFYCYNYFLRVSPSVMQNDLMQNFHISASQFGNLAAFYYYAYTLMQIPVGMIYDRFGVKFVLFFACLIAVTGLSIFIGADNYLMAVIGRFLVGFGSAFAYIGVLKLGSLWLPANRFALIAGLTTAFGMAAAIFSDFYLTDIVQMVGYKNALHTALIVGAALSVFIIFFMRSKPIVALSQPGTVHKPMSFVQMLNSVLVVLSKPQMWLIGIVGCLFYLPASVFLDLWGISFLKSVYHTTPKEADFVVLCTFSGWIVASPTICALSDKLKRRRLPLLVCAVMSAILFSAVFYYPAFSLNELYVIFFFIGVFCGAHPLCFALSKDNNSNAISATAVAITNTLIMLGGAIFQPIVGKLLDWHSSGAQTSNGILIYTSGDYLYALSVVPGGLVMAIALTFFLKETYCESREDVIALERQNTRSNIISLQTN